MNSPQSVSPYLRKAIRDQYARIEIRICAIPRDVNNGQMLGQVESVSTESLADSDTTIDDVARREARKFIDAVEGHLIKLIKDTGVKSRG